MISKIYDSPYCLHKVGNRKGRNRKEITLKETKFVMSPKKNNKYKKMVNNSGDKLTEWELNFIKDISKIDKLSEKQNSILNRIKKKCYSTKGR